MKNEPLWKPSRIIKNGDRYEIIKEKYGLASRYIGELVVPQYAETIARFSKGHLLDCGCGQAPYYIVYRDLVDKITCVDWDAADPEHDYLDYKVDLNKPLDIFNSESFDTILLADVLEHIVNPGLLFSEMTRILNPSGRIILFVPFYYWVHSNPHDYYRYTKFSLLTFCENNRLKVLYLEPYGGYLDILFDLFNKFFTNSEFGYRMLRKLSKIVKRSSYYKKRYSQRIENFPLGYILVAEKDAK